jgi:hypothetical protein
MHEIRTMKNEVQIHKSAAPNYYSWLFVQTRKYVDLRSLNFDFSSGKQSRLYGTGAFDSMQLVDFIMYVEDAFYADYGQRILLADADAFSQKRSPYLNLGSFAAFITQKAHA